MNGVRVDKSPHELEPGEYTFFGTAEDGEWYCRTPTGAIGALRGHDVVEHDDGTITVSPSILVNKGRESAWHGYLERGVWREV